MNERVLVTGGTGLLGREVVERLVRDGRDVRVVSRGHRTWVGRHEWVIADLRSGDGVAEAMSGVTTVVHCATAFGRQVEPVLARTMAEAARRACAHLVYVSIVGVDRVPLPYYQGKLAAERVVEESGAPHTILRATQFHDLLRALFASAARSPVMPVPAVPFQPVDAGEVADRLADLALGEPRGRVADLGGPRVRSARDLAGAFLRATGRRRPLLPVRLPGRTFRAYRAGGHLAPDHADGTVTFEDYLAAHPDPSATSYRP
ncbi:SDR family oxidoreductase [Saccharothrix hoggarensis]|uniref:SDR family oxidoreductase n=1 Tax=Saccharothrix hoggarensis TaxID=913853 RepID=A0ABW3R0U2_9PSEU